MNAQRAAHARSGGSALERIVVAERPPLTLVARSGDPRGAVAFVAAHARGSMVSAALTGVLAARLESAGVSAVEARAHGLGLELSRAVDGPREAARFIEAVGAALAQPISLGDPAIQRARHELAALHAFSFAGPGESAVAACSGELGLERDAPPLDLATPAGVARLDDGRKATFQAEAAAFSALGSAEVLDAAAQALAAVAAWPTGAADAESWPTSDAILVDTAPGVRRLSLALRVGNADTAIGAGAALGARDSELLERLAALNPAWRLERATSVAHPRGGCLRLDLVPPKGDPAPTTLEVSRVAALAELSAAEALTHAEPGALDESVIRPSNPQRAATLAAWRALPTREENVATRTTIAYLNGSGDAVSSAELGAALNTQRARLLHPTFELSTRVEAGQGELWVLLASPCGTASESAQNAGALALALRALTLRSSSKDVQLEPWVTPDGVGLLAHAPRRTSGEAPAEHAARIGSALGRALGPRLQGNELGAARAVLLEELGSRPLPGWSLMLEGLSPGRLSWLEPRGEWASVSELSGEEVERARRYLLAGPLKLAVLASHDDGQAALAARAVQSWLLTAAPEVGACPATRTEAPRRGEARLEEPEGSSEGGYVGVAFSDTGPQAAQAATLTAFVLNRPGGALERALTAAGPTARAAAHALGGLRRPALVVEVRALPSRLAEAIASVRAALDELGRGRLTSEEFALASHKLAERELAEHFDPRRRIVDLFRGARPTELDLAGLRTQQAALTAASQWVVTVTRAP